MKIVMTYIGLRFFSDDEISPAFIDDKGKIGYWKHARFCQIGHRYITEKTKTAHTMKRIPEETGAPVNDEKLLSEWKLEDQAARNFRKRKAAAKKAAKFSFTDKTLEELYLKIKKLDHRTKREVIDAVKFYLEWGQK